MSLVRLAQHLRASQESIMQRWKATLLQGAVPSARELPELQLRNHLPLLLQEIADAVEGGGTPAVEQEGREHGRQRWGSGYNIAEVLRELSVLRALLVDVIEAYARGDPGLGYEERMEALRRIHATIDRSGQAGVAQFYAETVAVHRLLEAELRVANEQKDRFLAMLSHELRNPLAPILTAVQLLEFTETDDPRLRRAREIIERQVRHQARLIDDLLDVSRITQGKIALRLEVHDLKAAVADAADGCLPAIQSKQQELRVDLPEEPLFVDADPVRLAQVVTNLLTNANRYTEPGGRIGLTVTQEAGQAVIRVRDTGSGISPEFLPRVFTLFTQADTSLDRRHGGLGIGLALVKSLVELHGGAVEAHSAGLGQGSEFVVRLPVVTAPAPAAALRIKPSEPALPKRRIAVVEDNPDSRTLLVEVLELLGHQVVPAANADEALRLAREAMPEAFVVDIGLPGMDGYQLARELRQLPGGEGALLIALTGYGGPEQAERAREAGFDAHLTKPADIENLERVLARHL